jgi:hypothetical protein
VFKDLLDALEISQLVVIIDEWTELDRSAQTWVQPFFAKYLRRAFFGDAQFCIKISAIKDESIFGKVDDHGQYIRLQVGDDIFDNVNLDVIYANRMINLEEFYTVLLFRRSLHCEPRLSVFSRDLAQHKKDPAEEFLDFLFGDKNVLPELLVASSGIPRHFISIFESIAQYHDYSVYPHWKMSVVRERITHSSVMYVGNTVDNGSVEQHLLRRIKEVIDRTKQRTVLLPKKLIPA